MNEKYKILIAWQIKLFNVDCYCYNIIMLKVVTVLGTKQKYGMIQNLYYFVFPCSKNKTK